MGEKLIVGPFNKGKVTNRQAFYIDNDSFPTLKNAYQWRGRIKRKRGTEQLTRLKRPFDSTSTATNPGTTTQTLDGSGNGNLLTGFTSSGIQSTATLVPTSVTITAPGPTLYTDPAGDGTLSPSGSINYATGAITIAAEASNSISASFAYYPNLPVLGLEDFSSPTVQFPGIIAFDNVYSYVINTTTPYVFYANNYYKNPATGTYSGYTQKQDASMDPISTSFVWNGQDYQQFWTANYQGALFTTNGIEVPFDITNVGMQYKSLTSATVVSGTDVDFVTTNNHPFVEGDFIFINEVNSVTGLNFQTGFVLGTPAPTATTFRASFPTATIGAGPANTGIVQALTTNCQPDVSSTSPTSSKDCIRWYDGTPVSKATPPVFSTGFGWVNFCPPLIDTGSFSIGDLPAGQYYLVGARMIIPFKDRLLFLGPVVQTSSAGSQKYLQDTVIYSQNGTPYYTCTFPYTSVVPTVSTIVAATITEVLVPADQSAYPSAWWENTTGYGGFISAGYDEPINTAVTTEDVIICGFDKQTARLVYNGNDILPFTFYVINSEYGSTSTFSAIDWEKGAITLGPNGITIATQNQVQRLDLDVPDEVFRFNLGNNGSQRVSGIRDFINEWMYFTYSAAAADAVNYFPNQTLFYNYRDNSWAVFEENYTTYGTLRKTSGETWADLDYFLWDEWTDPWGSGENTLYQPEIIAGNQQGFVMVKSEGIGEDASGYISAISSSSVVTSNDHGLNDGDYIIISDCVGTIGTYVNGRIFSVSNPATNSFTLNPTVTSGTYLGAGQFTRLSVPKIQTKEFPPSWAMGRKTRIGVQQYLLSKTDVGQITLQIYLNQNQANPYNESFNDSTIYSQVLYTCPEGTNLGLTAANANLQMPTASNQQQIWHRMNTSLIGDTVQLGFTLSDTQMRSLTATGSALTITGATQANPCVLTVANNLGVGNLVTIADVSGMTELNSNTYIVTAASSTTLTIQVDSTGFTAYTEGGTATPVAPVIQESEIELHGFVIDLSPSSLLS